MQHCTKIRVVNIVKGIVAILCMPLLAFVIFYNARRSYNSYYIGRLMLWLDLIENEEV